MDCLQQLANPDSRKALLSRIFCQLVLLCVLFLAFIIPDIVFANREVDCLILVVPQTSFSLQTWLQIDAYTRAGVYFFLVFISITLCLWIKWGGVMLMCLCLITMLYSIFTGVWAIIGIHMFWKHLLPQNLCTKEIQLYVYFMPVFSIVLSCLTFYLAKDKSDKVKEATQKDEVLKLRYGNNSIIPC